MLRCFGPVTGNDRDKEWTVADRAGPSGIRSSARVGLDGQTIRIVREQVPRTGVRSNKGHFGSAHRCLLIVLYFNGESKLPILTDNTVTLEDSDAERARPLREGVAPDPAGLKESKDQHQAGGDNSVSTRTYDPGVGSFKAPGPPAP